VSDATDGVEAGVEALVPVRGLPAGKTRLAALLTVDQRNRLVRAMLADVVAALRASAGITGVTIVSGDDAAGRVAAELGVGFLRQPQDVLGLNAGLAWAQRALADREAVLIVPADLPLVMPADVDLLLRALPDGPAVGIAPSRDGGTNGLLLRPPGVIAPHYGPESARRHAEAAAEVGVPARRVESEGWRLDLDAPEDLGRLLALAHEGVATQTVACLRSEGFPEGAVG